MWTKDLSLEFPEITDPDWLEARETCWQRVNENGLLDEFRRKEIKEIKEYFFTGKLGDSKGWQDKGTLFYCFPVQLQKGYDYLYRHIEFSREEYRRMIFTAFLDLRMYGYGFQEAVNYYDYHVGNVFRKEVHFLTPNGTEKLDLPTERLFGQVFGAFVKYLIDPDALDLRLVTYAIPYFESLFNYRVKYEGFDFTQDPKLLRLCNKVANRQYMNLQVSEEVRKDQEELTNNLVNIMSIES